MDKYFILIISTIVLFLLLTLLRILLRKWDRKINEKEKNTESKKIIKQPLVYKYLGIIGSISGLLTITLCFIFVEELLATILATAIVFAPLSIGCFLIILYEKNWRIELCNDSFIFKNIYGRKFIFLLSEVTVKSYKNSYRVYKNNKKIVSISYMQNDCMILFTAISKNKN